MNRNVDVNMDRKRDLSMIDMCMDNKVRDIDTGMDMGMDTVMGC